MQCALCGYPFDETQLTCHTACPLQHYCAVICCPNCGHQTVDESKSTLVQSLRQVASRLAVRQNLQDKPSDGRLRDSQTEQGAMLTEIRQRGLVMRSGSRRDEE